MNVMSVAMRVWGLTVTRFWILCVLHVFSTEMVMGGQRVAGS